MSDMIILAVILIKDRASYKMLKLMWQVERALWIGYRNSGMSELTCFFFFRIRPSFTSLLLVFVLVVLIPVATSYVAIYKLVTSADNGCCC